MTARARTVLAVWVALLLCATGSATAAAATRYATPNPAPGADCSQARPCDLTTAFSGASSGDTIVVGSGTYGSGQSPLHGLSDNGKSLVIRGASVGPGRPEIQLDGSVVLTGSGTGLSDLAVDMGYRGEGPSLQLDGFNESLTRVRVTSSGRIGGAACVVDNNDEATIVDSVCAGDGPNGVGGSGLDVHSGSVTLRNDTLLGQDGLAVLGGTVTAANSIFAGEGDGQNGSGEDIYDGGQVTLTHCEYSVVTGPNTPTSSSQVTGYPKFVNDYGGAVEDRDFHVLADSPGVDAGQDSADNGPYDLDGGQRQIGTHTDIGAYELPGTPSLSTGSATDVGAQTAMLHGTLSQAGAGVDYHFEYGTTTAYGASTSDTFLPGSTSPADVSASVANLDPSTTYHYRIVATFDDTTLYGDDATFTTTVLPAPLNVVRPRIAGAAQKGSTLACSPGSWRNAPTLYTYAWSRNGTPLHGATGQHYNVKGLDQGSTLTCTVTASNQTGTAAAHSAGVRGAIHVSPGCPKPSGGSSGTTLGRVWIGMTRTRAEHAYGHSHATYSDHHERFCLTPAGVSVDYARPKLLKSLSAPARTHWQGRIVAITTGNPMFAVQGIRVGATLAAAQTALQQAHLFKTGSTTWLLDAVGTRTVLVGVKDGLVTQVGIAALALTDDLSTQHAVVTDELRPG